MGSCSIPGILGLLCLLAVGVGLCWCEEQQSIVLSSFNRPETWLRPYDWTYMRVELPPWFSYMTMVFTSDVDIGRDKMKHLPKSRLPVICFKDGSPPLPDLSDHYSDILMSNFLVNGSFGGEQHLNTEQCIPFQKNVTMTLANDQISPGVWYFGFFNGLGPARTQSQMISRGPAYKFSTSINVHGCVTSTIWGPYCNQTIDTVSCSQSSIFSNSSSLFDRKMLDGGLSSLNQLASNEAHVAAENHLLPEPNSKEATQKVSNSSMFASADNLITCNNSFESSCLSYGEFKFYFLDIVGVASHFKIIVTDLKLNQTSPGNSSTPFDGTLLMCYARHEAMPVTSLHDHSSDISRVPLVVKSPKVGRWYIAIQAVNQTNANNVTQEMYFKANMCFSLEWQVHECLNGKAGLNCSWEAHMLQRVPRRGSSIPFESYFLPLDENMPMEHTDFSLDHLLSNSSIDNETWTYLLVDIPHGTAGANMHVQLLADTNLNYEVFSKYGGLADIDNWDYYINSSSSRNDSTLLALNDASGESIDFYLLSAREGIWCFGLKHPPVSDYSHRTMMTIALEGCPNHCSRNGQCRYSVEGSGLAFYSYCVCDRDHGGFDCSNELVSHEGHIWQSIFLIASNAAAILPAFWALRQKAFAEWVLFTSSGISSGLYHACDVGTWCALSFRVLQFMDFWLSFMAVVSTFVYMATIAEASKRAIHTVVFIITALLAISGATRSSNIVIVIAIGSLGLVVGWLLEFSTSYRFAVCPRVLGLDMNERWLHTKRWFWNLVKTLRERFRWPFLSLGFVGLAFAGTSWKLETNETYWIWHSLWHISMYTCSFFFLCSTCVKSSNEPLPAEYELTRQDSSSRIETETQH
ncbi:uncharacterized protein M6B38_259140 [Iris pallida]|uniref:EGF-like domain-containing protein n=1 Tax=Iris pallida TaxID=29817 RepID=A0AAX6IEV5_IRIPA|nr:uncharacterized protein M6B38_259140 [Iris pallida]